MEQHVDLEWVPARTMAAVRFHATGPDMGPQMGPAFGTVMAYLSEHGLSPSGPALARYEVAGDGFDVEAGFIVADPVEGDGTVVRRDLPPGDVAHLTYLGAYDGLPTAYATMHQVAETMGRPIDDGAAMWEEYWSPPDTPPEDTRTEIYWPIVAA